MASNCSFTEYVAERFDDNFLTVAGKYQNDNKDSLCCELRRVHRSGEMEISEGDYHYDDSEVVSIEYEKL